MSGRTRPAPLRPVLVMGAALLLLTMLIAAPAFAASQTPSTVSFGSSAFTAQWAGAEATTPNFWGPAYQAALNEAYQEATGGSRLVQYFDKARMEQTTTGGPVTNGLLTVELVTGQRQMGDTAFAPFAPSALPIVGDLDNTWPTYAAIGGNVFAPRVARSGESVGTVYKSDGTFGVNPGLAVYPGAAMGTYQVDPGGRYAHNVPLAFSAFLATLPTPPLPAMGLPLTEPFWVNVAVNAAPTWVMVQPFERRVLFLHPHQPPPLPGRDGQHRPPLLRLALRRQPRPLPRRHEAIDYYGNIDRDTYRDACLLRPDHAPPVPDRHRHRRRDHHDTDHDRNAHRVRHRRRYRHIHHARSMRHSDADTRLHGDRDGNTHPLCHRRAHSSRNHLRHTRCARDLRRPTRHGDRNGILADIQDERRRDERNTLWAIKPFV